MQDCRSKGKGEIESEREEERWRLLKVKRDGTAISESVTLCRLHSNSQLSPLLLDVRELSSRIGDLSIKLPSSHKLGLRDWGRGTHPQHGFYFTPTGKQISRRVLDWCVP